MYEAPVFEPDVEASELPRRTVGVLVMVKCSGDFALVIQLRKGVCVLVLDEVVEKVAGLFGVGWASVAGGDCWCRQVVHSEGYFQVASSLSSARPERLDAVSDVVEAVIGSGGEIVGNQGWRRKALCCVLDCLEKFSTGDGSNGGVSGREDPYGLDDGLDVTFSERVLKAQATGPAGGEDVVCCGAVWQITYLPDHSE